MARGRREGEGPARVLGTLGAVGLVLALLLAACSGQQAVDPRADREASGPSGSPEPSASRSAPTTEDRGSPSSRPRPTRQTQPRGPMPSDGRPAEARLAIPTLGLSGLRVVPYRGFTDDAPGTDIQNAGDAASPYGPRGGVGPGGLGNYQVTGHRLSSTEPFRYLPQVRRGDEVHVDVGRTRYVYSVVGTRWTSFRSERSLLEQRAAVPGRPGVEPTRAMITVSTCATPEDHADGNYWSDEFDNPEHRIDKIGVLERVVDL